MTSNTLMKRIQRPRDAAQSLRSGGIPADVSEAVVRRSFRVPHERPTDLAHKFHANDRQRTLSAADVRRILDAADESSAEEENEEEEEEEDDDTEQAPAAPPVRARAVVVIDDDDSSREAELRRKRKR